MRKLEEMEGEKPETEVEIEHNHLEKIDRIGGGEHAAHEECPEPETAPDHWFGKLSFLSLCLGYALFLGDLWRYLCHRNDSGISLIPYVTMLFTGIPLFEQFTRPVK